jgi:hypothetical protein
MTIDEIAKNHDIDVATMMKDYKQYWKNVQDYIAGFPMIDERYHNDTISKMRDTDIKLTHLGILKFDKNIRYKYLRVRRKQLYEHWRKNKQEYKVDKHRKQIKEINYEN